MQQINELEYGLIDSESLFFTEKNLREQIKGCEYWGELKLSKRQVEQLCSMLSQKYRELPESKRIEKLYKGYPVSMITSMIFYIVFDYQDEFWENWAEQVGISLNQARESYIGRFVRNFFDENRFSYETDGYRNITPLLCQAGIPDSYLEDLFRVLNNAGNLEPDEIIQELKGWRRYQIRKPVERFIRLHEKKMTTLLLIIDDVMKNNENLNADDLYEQRIAEKFSIWKEENLSRNGTYRGKSIFQEKPHLAYDGAFGLCMILPEYFIEDEYCAEILWRISSDEKVLHNLRCSVVNEGLKIHTIEKKIPVRVCQNYTVSLLDPESADGGRKLREDWNITGSGERRFMLFDYKGKQRTDQTYPMDGGVLLLNQDCHAEFVSTWYNELFQSIEVDYATMEFLPKDNSSCIRIDDEEGTCLRVRKSIKTELQGGRLLFADAVSSDKTPIFTELPDFGFVSEESTHLSVLIRNRDTGYKNSFSLEDEFFHTEEHTTWKYYNLKNFLPEGSGYGRYVMRIYEQGNFKKEMEFAFVPEIEFDNCDISLWPEPKGMASSAFRYRLRQGIQIDFSSSVKSSNEICEGEVWKRLEALDNNDFLEGVLLLEEERIRIPFKKRIKGLQWAVWNWDNAELNYSDDINKISKAEYQSESWYLTMRSAPENMKEDGLKLCLYSSSNELIQEYPVIPNQRGVWQLDLGVFAVSIENCKLPAELRFARKREGSEYRILKIYEPVMMEGLQIKKGAVPQRLIWTKSNIEDIEERLSIQSLTDYDEECRAFEHIQCVEDECGKTYFYIILEPPLRNSIYKVAYSKPDDDFFDFSEYCIEALPDCNTFMVNPADELNKIKSKGISEFVKAITISYRSLEPLKKLEVILDERIDGIMGRLLENDLKQIAALTLYAIRDEQGECEIIIRNLLSKIYDELMQSAEKQCLYQLLMRTESTDIEKNKARHFFRMDYLSLKGIDYSQQDIKRLLRSDVFLGLRGLLIQPKGRWMAEPLINYIGIEALSNLIKFEDKDESRISLFEKWLLGEEIPYKIELNDNLIGNSNTFYEMFEWGRGYNKPKLNMDKKPKNELIFWGSGYIQLLIRWYYQGIDKHPQELNAAKKLAPTIDRLLSKSAAGADSVIKAYSRRICCRETESKSGFYPVLKASAACGMLIALEEQSKLHLLPEDKRTLTEFMYLMDEVFPELLKRDILLAQLYLFVTEV